MRKKLQFLMIFLAIGLATTLSAQENNDFHVHFSVMDATCYNNGKVLYALVDSVGAVLDSLPPGLSQTRAYYKLFEGDSAHYAGWYYVGGTDTLTVNYGTYIVGVEALLDDGSGGFVRLDTQTVVTISTTYHKPTVAVVSQDVDFMRSLAGTLYTVPCQDIGRVQLRILYGQFPYVVTVSNQATGDTLRTVIFNERQYDGDDETYYNYKDYYSIDSMPGGPWTFRVEDGCGYGLPEVVATVHTRRLPSPIVTYIYSSSGDFVDSNVVKIALWYDYAIVDLMDLVHQHARYRFRHAGLSDGEWRVVPYDTTVLGYLLTLYDTVSVVDRYCELWNRDITLEYQTLGCGTSSFSNVIQIYKPNEIYFVKDSVDAVDSVSMEAGNCIRNQAWHRENYSIHYYKKGLSIQYDPNYLGKTDHEFYRYHYTHPLTWVYTDRRTGAVLKRDTVSIITEKSLLTAAEVYSFYGVAYDSTLVIPLERKLLDGKGCELYTTFDTVRYMHCVSHETPNWQVDFKDEGDKCCLLPRWVRLYRNSGFGAPVDGTVVRLVRSPLNNLYNFEAVYHEADNSWSVVRDHVGNTAAITGMSGGISLVISDYCLPSGPYEFEVTTTCGTDRVSENVPFNDHRFMRLSQEIEYVTERDCGNLYIHYTKGGYQWVVTNTSPETGLPLDTVFEGVGLKATVIRAPAASLVGQSSFYTPQFTFSIPGTYVLSLCPNLALDACMSDLCYYDTFHLDAATVEFIEALAVLCDTTSTEGNVWVRAGNGMPPYTYTLYSQPDKQGDVLAVNDSGVFTNVPMRSNQTLSCLVRDSCNAYFHVNIQPSTMADLQKLWFDGGVTETSACEGSTIRIHALAVGDIWQYEWSGPDGFTSTSADPYVFIPRGGGDGWYKVTIRQTDCASELSDSLDLTTLPAPSLSLSPDTTVCPGETMEARFTPHSDTGIGDIQFSVAFANASGVQVRRYTAPSDVIVVDTFSTLSPAKIYPASIRDEHCEYTYADADDTVYIRLRTDVAEGCHIVTTFDTVCYGGDARLTAAATAATPYTLRWYGDYNLKKLLKTETMTGSDQRSYYDTSNIFRRTLLYVSLQTEGMCPSVNGLTDSTMNMKEGETILSCGRHIRFYDSGGPDGSTASDEPLVHRFRTSDSTRVSLHFEEANLTGSAHLLIFAGDSLRADSLLLDVRKGNLMPQTVVSSGNVLTVCLTGQKLVNSDWSAVVEAAPGIAVADVQDANTVWYRDEVCQRRSGVYDDPYGMVPGIVSAEEVAQAVRKAGNYYYTKTFPADSIRECDSTVNFTLVVNPPEMREASATVVQQRGYLWRDSLYRESGHHAVLVTSADGCDFLDVLNLTVIEAHCPDAEICLGDSASLSVTATLSSEGVRDTLLPKAARPGDVLCADGSVLPVDSFLVSGKSAKGIVFYVDETGFHGRAVALTETKRMAAYATPPLVLLQPIYRDTAAIRDWDGEANTLHLKALDAAYNGVNFNSDATAISYCYYFNHNTLATDGEWHGWYLPSYGELSLMQSHVWEIRRTLNKLCQQNSEFKPFGYYSYWSSTSSNASRFWRISFSGWIQEDYRSAWGVRPVTKF